MAEAIENEAQVNQLVTVPILDAKVETLKSDLVRWVLTAMMAQTSIVLAFTYALLHTH